MSIPKRKRSRPKPRTLSNIRKDAPARDRGLPALRAPVQPINPASRYLPTQYQASTLDQLRQGCGRYGDAAIDEAQWSAIETWLMGMGPGDSAPFSNSREVLWTCYALCRDARRIDTGWPSLTGKPFTSQLVGLSPDVVAEAWAVCADTLADWQRAGSPRLASAVQSTRSYIHAVQRQSIKEEPLSA